MLKETFKKLKAKIAAILGISILTLGGVQININIDTQKFWKEVEKGKLYVTSFNIKEYKELRPLLVEEMKKKNPSHQAKSLWTQTIKKEMEEKSWEFDKKPEEVLDIKSPEFLIRLNEKLEETIKLEDKK